jgi:hypothetical protein
MHIETQPFGEGYWLSRHQLGVLWVMLLVALGVSERWDGTWVIYPKAHTVAETRAHTHIWA